MHVAHPKLLKGLHVVAPELSTVCFTELSTVCYTELSIVCYTHCCRHHEAELRQSREECWGRQQELAAVREKLTNLKTTLEDRRKDIVSYKVMPCGSECLLPPPSSRFPPLPNHSMNCSRSQTLSVAGLKSCQCKSQDNDLKPQFPHLFA